MLIIDSVSGFGQLGSRRRWPIIGRAIPPALVALLLVGACSSGSGDGDSEPAVSDATEATTSMSAVSSTSPDNDEAIALVIAHNDAQNSQDRDTMMKTLTADAVFANVKDGRELDAMSRDDYVQVVMSYGSVPTTFTDTPTMTGPWEVTVPAHIDRTDSGAGMEYDATFRFTLREVDGELKIAKIERITSE